MKAISYSLLILAALCEPKMLRAEPVAQGLPLSAWLGWLKTPVIEEPEDNVPGLPDEAVRHERELRQALRSLHDTRVRAMQALRDLRAEAAPAIPTLIELLGSENAYYRASAISTLAAIASPALTPLTRALTDGNAARRTGAACALGLIGHLAKEAQPALVKALADSTPAVRDAAAEALWDIEKNPVWVRALANRLATGNDAVRRDSLTLLAAIGPPARDAVPALIKALAEKREPAGELRNAHLRSIHALVAETLARVGPDAKGAIPALSALLRRPDKAASDDEKAVSQDIRISAALALLEIGADKEPLLPVLMEGLRYPIANQRDLDKYLNVVASFSRIGSGAIPGVVRALDDEDPYVRIAAIHALCRFDTLPKELAPRFRRERITVQGGPACQPLILVLVRTGARLNASEINTLCELTFESYFTSSDQVQRDAVLRGLTKSKNTTVPLLVKAIERDDPKVRVGAAELLAHLGPVTRGTAPALLRLLKTEKDRNPTDSESPARTWAAIGLLNMGPHRDEAVAPLVESFLSLAKSRTPAIRGFGGNHSEQMREIGRSEAIVESLARASRAENAEVIRSLIDAFGASPDRDSRILWDLLDRIHKAKAAPVVKMLADSLVAGNDRARETAACILAQIGRDAAEAAPMLEIALSDPLPIVRVHAAGALWTLEKNADHVLPILRDALKSSDLQARMYAVVKLKAIGPAARPCLAEVTDLLGDLNETREAERFFFSMVPDAAPALVELLNHPKPVVRARAAALLGDFGPAAVEALICVVRRNDAVSLPLAVEALNRQGNHARAALPVLRPLLQYGDERLQVAAALAVWSIGKEAKEGLPILLRVVRRAGAADRLRVIEAIGAMGKEAVGAVAVLEQVLGDEDLSLRMFAIVALGKVHEGRRALPALLRALREDESDPVRAQVLQTLPAIVKDKADAKSVVGPLTKMLTDHNDPLRSYAIGTLLELSDLVMPPIPVLIELLDDDAVAGGRLCRLLAKGVPESVPYLTAALNHKRPDVRGQAAMALAYCGPKAKDAVSELTCALHSSDSRLRYAAAHALRNIGPDAKEALVSLRAAFADEEEHIRKMAKEAVEAIEKK